MTFYLLQIAALSFVAQSLRNHSTGESGLGQPCVVSGVTLEQRLNLAHTALDWAELVQVTVRPQINEAYMLR